MSDYNDLELQEQLMNQLEEMQTEIDQYKLTIADLQSEVSKKDSQLSEVLEQAETLSRENSSLNSQLEQARQSANSSEVYQLREAISELRKDNRQKSETIKSLNERIGTLSESDNVLKQNAELKQKNSELQRSEQNARQEAKATVSDVKEQYASKQAELERKIASAEYRERQASTLEANLSHQADTRAQKLAENKLKALQGEYEAKKRSLDSEYKTLTVGYEGFLLGCLLYGVLVTLFTAVRSEAFISDFKTFFITIWQFIVWLVESLVSLGEWASQLGDMIPQPIVAFIVHWLLWILACIGLGIGIVILLLTGFFKWLEWFKENQADLVALSVFLVSLALIIFFAEVFKAFLPVNLLLLLLLVQIVTMGIRAYIQACKRNRGYY